MQEKRVNLFLVFAVAIAAVSAALLFAQPWGTLVSVINVLALVAEALILRFTQPEALKRGLSLEFWWDRLLAPAIALCAVAAAVLSVLDALSLGVSPLPGWTFLVGILLLMSAFLIIAQSMRANPPHGEEKYGEAPREDMERGPYEVVRHPVMLAVLLGGLSIPLVIGSGIGFIPVGLMAVAIVARVANEDDWRFNNYEWFYDYTKEVSYRLIPFIW